MVSLAVPICNCCNDGPTECSTQPSIVLRRRACARAKYSRIRPNSVRSSIGLSLTSGSGSSRLPLPLPVQVQVELNESFASPTSRLSCCPSSCSSSCSSASLATVADCDRKLNVSSDEQRVCESDSEAINNRDRRKTMLSLVEMRQTATHASPISYRPPRQSCIVVPSITNFLLPTQPITAAITVCAAAPTATATATASSPSNLCPSPVSTPVALPLPVTATALCKTELASPSVTPQSQAQTQTQTLTLTPSSGGKSGSVKSTRSHMSLVERAQNRRTWHLNNARDRVTSLSIPISTTTSSVAMRRGMPSPLRVTVSNSCLSNSGELQSPTSLIDRTAERDEAPELRPASRILPLLFIGSECDASDMSKLEALGIGYVLNVTNHVQCYFDGHPGLVYERIPANDCERQDLKRYFRTAIEFIERARRDNVGCLVHCVAGVSRSPTIVLAYLMHTHGWSMMKAYDFVKERRSWIAPNFNFVGQLKVFEYELAESGRLHADHPVESVANPSSETVVEMDASKLASQTSIPSDSSKQLTQQPNDFDSDSRKQSMNTNSSGNGIDAECDANQEQVLLMDSAPKAEQLGTVERSPHSEPCRSVKLRGEYYTLATTYPGSLVCGMDE